MLEAPLSVWEQRRNLPFQTSFRPITPVSLAPCDILVKFLPTRESVLIVRVLITHQPCLVANSLDDTTFPGSMSAQKVPLQPCGI